MILCQTLSVFSFHFSKHLAAAYQKKSKIRILVENRPIYITILQSYLIVSYHTQISGKRSFFYDKGSKQTVYKLKQKMFSLAGTKCLKKKSKMKSSEN